jgi:hypothetical protein
MRIIFNLKNIFFLVKRIYIYSLVKFVLPCFVIKTEDLVSQSKKFGTLLQRYDSENFHVKPTGDRLADDHFRKLLGNHEVKGQFLIKMHEIFLVTRWLIPVTNDGRIILETSGTISMLLGNVRRSGDGVFPVLRFFFTLLRLKLSKFMNLNFVNALVSYKSLFHMVPRHGFSSGNPAFSHWVFENLPQVRMYYEAIKDNQNVKILVGPKMKDWQALSLKLLGIDSNQVVEDIQPYCIKVDNFYLSRLPYIHTNVVQFDPDGRRWVSKMLRNSLKKELSSGKSEKNTTFSQKIAISRFYCHRRRLIDEQVYWEKLESSGFKIVFPEKLSEYRKITSCYKAKVLLAFPSGSAIANMIYSKDARLVEVLPSTSYISVWFLLSRELGFSYSLILAETKGKGRDNDYKISTEQIFGVLSKV